jgi:pSer/pThr/pTyr-binding forkhead associated (FHA) protein
MLNGTTALLPTVMPASEEPTQMPHAGSPAEPALLVVHSGESSHAIAPGSGVVTIGNEPEADVRIDDPRISEAHLQAVSDGGRWRIVDSGRSGMFVDGQRESSVTVNDKTTVRFGDPTGGKALTFEIVRPSSTPESGESAGDEPDPGLARAGAAAAARRRELDISQRSLAADGIINAGALIAFEKGRSWPRERTRAKLEEVLQWPAGTIARIRDGAPAVAQTSPQATPPSTPFSKLQATPQASAEGPAALIAQAIAAAVVGCSLAVAALPPVDDPDFPERSAPILADLRQLETIAVRATRISRITPELIKALATVRRNHDALMILGASAPHAPLAQRLYAARRRANLSVQETANAVGVPEEMIVAAEAGEPLPPNAADAIQALLDQIS